MVEEVVLSTVHSRTVPPNPHNNVRSVEERQSNEEGSKNLRVTDSLDGNSVRAARPPPRVPSAKPGRVVGPVLPSENVRSTKDSYDPRFYRNAVLPPQSISPHCFFRPQSVGNEKPVRDSNRNTTSQEKLVNTASPQVNPNPYFPSQASSIGQKLNERIAMEAKMFQAQSQFGTVGAVTMSAHRNVGSVQYG
ncbi:hypothetical protein CRG98_025336 [Punica granatum]|uniref:Uncharacterized protein n=1 Tax=Punica granatum TaxID=22663 RepID=A0A2I0JF28_PUNGR|nr:hypothetical protein CRG98_025336 [Punica granatum]